METNRSGFLQTLLCVVCVCMCVRCGGVLVCHYCPLQARGGRCSNITTECAPRERCFTGWRHYGPVLVLAGQGCASPELCGSNHTHTLMGFEYQISYTCCARDLCNEARAQGNPLRERIAVTPGVVCQTLVCYFCPLTSHNRTCKHVLSECAPRELCFTARGRYGHATLLFSKGCASPSDCARPATSAFRGNNVTLTYSCCGSRYCNSCPRIACDPALLAVTAIAVSVFAGWT